MEGRHPRPLSATFVGRGAILANLRGLVDETCRGRGHVVLVSGEPGIGKTSLALRLTEDLDANEVTVLWGSCWEGDGAPTLWPWIQVLRDLTRRRNIRALLLELGPAAAEVIRLLPEVSSAPERAADAIG